MGISKASAQWQGGFKTGRGTMKPAQGSDTPFTAGSRFEGQPSSNPEELIGAALAGCFSMALTVELEKAGASPQGVKTDANVHLEKQGEGFTITRIELNTVANASGIDAAKFQNLAETTKKNCPVGKALASTPITLQARLAT